MNLSNYNEYACFEYESIISGHDDFKLGDVVIREINEMGVITNEIGIIIQIHSSEEFRTDMFGNCHSSEIRLATQLEIDKLRPNILNETITK